MVPTVDTTRNMFLLNALVGKGYHTLAVGNTGTGKTVLAMAQQESLSSEAYAKLTLYFSAATSSLTVQEIIEGSLEKRSRRAQYLEKKPCSSSPSQGALAKTRASQEVT